MLVPSRIRTDREEFFLVAQVPRPDLDAANYASRKSRHCTGFCLNLHQQVGQVSRFHKGGVTNIPSRLTQYECR